MTSTDWRTNRRDALKQTTPSTQAEEVEVAVRLAQFIVETYAKSKGSRELSHSVRDALLLSEALLAARDDAAKAEREAIVAWLDTKAEQAIENDRRDFSDALGVKEMLTDADLRMARRLATKKGASDSNIDSVLARVPAMVEEIERHRAAASPLNTPGVDIGEAEDLALELRDYLNHEAMDNGDPGGKLRDFEGAITRLLVTHAELARMRAAVEAAVEWNDAEIGEENVSIMDDREPAVRARQRTTRAINNLRDTIAMYRAEPDTAATAMSAAREGGE